MPTLSLIGTSIRERTEEIMQILEQGVNDVFTSGRYAEYLSVMSRFWRYSFRNCLLILLQLPEATRIAGIGTWNHLGRKVRKGEHGIRILAPAPYKKQIWTDLLDSCGKPVVNPDTGKIIQTCREAEVMSFKPVIAFDLSQTEGDPLPELAAELDGEIPDFDLMLHAIRSIAGCPIFFQPISGKSYGYYSVQEKSIVIRVGLSPLQTIKTALHEIAHARLHDPYNQPSNHPDGHPGQQKNRHAVEVEAESVAFIVMTHYSYDTSSYSFGYISSWSTGKELTELHSSLHLIQEESARIINDLDQALILVPIEQHPEPVTAC